MLNTEELRIKKITKIFSELDFEFIGLGTHTEDKNEMVIYKSNEDVEYFRVKPLTDIKSTSNYKSEIRDINGLITKINTRHFSTGDTVRHFKGGMYEVIGLGIDERINTPVIAYRALEGGVVWIRPLTMFNEKVNKPRKDNPTNQRYRFELREAF